MTTTTGHVSCADTAKLIRQALKEAFPGVKFGVRSKTYSGGASIDVTWTDGPRRCDVEQVAKAFEGASFDGMTDMKSYRRHLLDGAPVFMGADFIFCTQAISAAREAAAEAALERLDERQHNNLQAALRVGMFAGAYATPDPWTLGGWERANYIRQVARDTLPTVTPLPSPTVARVTSSEA